MRYLILLVALFGIHSCGNRDDTPQPENLPTAFDKEKWRTKIQEDYPYRDELLPFLLTNDTLKKMHGNQVLDFLGQPDRTDSSYLFYLVNKKKIGFFTLHSKTLVIKLKPDSMVEWRKVHK